MNFKPVYDTLETVISFNTRGFLSALADCGTLSDSVGCKGLLTENAERYFGLMKSFLIPGNGLRFIVYV
jgi:hypothetical protein